MVAGLLGGGSIVYKRLPVDQPSTDPFSGVFLGSFGQHGPELLLLQRSTAEVLLLLVYRRRKVSHQS